MWWGRSAWPRRLLRTTGVKTPPPQSGVEPCTLHACWRLLAKIEEPEGEVVEAAQAEAEAFGAGWAVARTSEVVAELGDAAGGLFQGQVGGALLGWQFFLNLAQRTSSSASV